MNNLGTVPGAGQPWKQQYDFNTEPTPSSLTWSAANPLPNISGGAQPIVTKNRVYLIGGFINNDWSESNVTYTAVINEDGTLEEWNKVPFLPTGVAYANAIVTKNRVYLIGGVTNKGKSNAVYTAIINKDGVLEDWVLAAILPATIVLTQVVVTKTQVYLLGGLINDEWSNIVYTAPINADGTLGTWNTTKPLPANIVESHAIVVKNRIYLLGGLIGNKASNVVYTTVINEDGRLKEWTMSNPLPRTITNSQAIVTRNRVFLLGGYVNDRESAAVHTAPINEDGTLGKWIKTTALPIAGRNLQTMITKGKIYLLGGIHDNDHYDDYSNMVYVADLPGGLNDYSEFY